MPARKAVPGDHLDFLARGYASDDSEASDKVATPTKTMLSTTKSFGEAKQHPKSYKKQAIREYQVLSRRGLPTHKYAMRNDFKKHKTFGDEGVYVDLSYPLRPYGTVSSTLRQDLAECPFFNMCRKMRLHGLWQYFSAHTFNIGSLYHATEFFDFIGGFYCMAIEHLCIQINSGHSKDTRCIDMINSLPHLRSLEFNIGPVAMVCPLSYVIDPSTKMRFQIRSSALPSLVLDLPDIREILKLRVKCPVKFTYGALGRVHGENVTECIDHETRMSTTPAENICGITRTRWRVIFSAVEGEIMRTVAENRG
ncbi:hypothetical protein EJ08DRAFT_732397 [Tothia fuscella]|uniref:Uncharacterized protein n=1 Tax=Tothia fuscella TaxID=1048955 RepID=A0A9P4U0P7_9PEZI|nr:hypothetical protein EJ08DRAFT_732397 [Tothia fuscella]